jgi:hypothetical protein
VHRGIIAAYGSWAYVTRGIDYILSCADPDISQHIEHQTSVTEPATGPHDGTDLLEEALADLVTHYNGHRRQAWN